MEFMARIREDDFRISSISKMTLIGIGVIQIILGIVSFACCIPTLTISADLEWYCHDCYYSYFSLSAQGIWAGYFTVISGCISIDFGVNPSRKTASYSIGFSTFATILNVAMVSLESVAVLSTNNWVMINLHIALLTFGCLQTIFTFTTSVLSCAVQGCCNCCTYNRVIVPQFPMATQYQLGAISHGYEARSQTSYMNPSSQMIGPQPIHNSTSLTTQGTNVIPGSQRQFPGTSGVYPVIPHNNQTRPPPTHVPITTPPAINQTNVIPMHQLPGTPGPHPASSYDNQPMPQHEHNPMSMPSTTNEANVIPSSMNHLPGTSGPHPVPTYNQTKMQSLNENIQRVTGVGADNETSDWEYNHERQQ